MPDRMRPTGSDSVARSDGGTGRFLSRQEATGTYAGYTKQGQEYLTTQRSTALRAWHAALANRNYANARVAFLGDSITEGFYSTSAPARRFTDLFRDRVRAKYPTAGIGSGGGYGYINQGTLWTPLTVASGVTQGLKFGLGMYNLTGITSGKTVTATIQGTGARILYVRYTGGGTFTWAVDGGSTTTINANGANTDPLSSALINLGSSGSHTLTITGGTSTLIMDGFVAYDGDETKGITVYNGGHTAWGSGDHLVTDASMTKDPVYSFALTEQPHLWVITLGINDWLFRKTTTSSAAYKANLQAIIATIKAASTVTPSIVLQATYQGGTTAQIAAAVAEPWQNYVDAMWAVAAADPSVCVLDLTKRWPVPSADNTLGLVYTDNLHPSDVGHSLIADTLVEFVSPR